ncbi:steroid transmembrane transporter SLC22A24 isoform X3 [Cherax quadricarinatus]|uniref:steroid transmembrane transporter SLC22A24 isoform X3 n=1 Tax=Cherax quadricarinatus TaxID=27406 RepID=UPI002379A84D|nr:organic cation transporter protein-like isoform X3 [Cherax quadricarinatus]
MEDKEERGLCSHLSPDGNTIPQEEDLASPLNTTYSEDNKNFKRSVQDAGGGFDEALEMAGSWGLWQKRVFIISHFSQVFCAMHAVSSAFLSFTQEHWCRVPGLEEALDQLEDPSVSSVSLKNISIPWGNKTGYDKCTYYDFNYTTLVPQLIEGQELEVNLSHSFYNASTASCDSWEFDTSVFKLTLVSEFSLVCGRRWLMATVQASYMSGLLIGSLVMGQLSDRFGRRTMAVLCALATAVVGTVACFVNSYLEFLALRFILAFVCSGMMIINFVLVMEIVKPEARTMTGMMYAFFFGSGIAILPGIAFFIRTWRYLELAIGLSSFILVTYYWILPESPRWLASQGRVDEALKILKNIARTNGKKLASDECILKLITLDHSKVGSPAHHEWTFRCLWCLSAGHPCCSRGSDLRELLPGEPGQVFHYGGVPAAVPLYRRTSAYPRSKHCSGHQLNDSQDWLRHHPLHHHSSRGCSLRSSFNDLRDRLSCGWPPDPHAPRDQPQTTPGDRGRGRGHA